MKRFYFACISILLLLTGCCRKSREEEISGLRNELYSLVDSVAGTVGIAVVSNYDTITINNGVRYPLMSVFKLHESLAVSDILEKHNNSIDSTIHVLRSEIDPDTWSPMLKVVGDGDFSITIRELLEYALKSSDNNASNILFDRIVSPAETNRFVKSAIADTTFNISFSEAEMKRNHELSYKNYTSPLSAALLIWQLFKTKIVNEENQNFIKETLSEVTTGQDRLGAPVAAADDVFFAHKTGSGYRNSCNELMAHNDVGYFCLPDGTDYSLAVFIRDFTGTEEEASSIIARISKIVYEEYTKI